MTKNKKTLAVYVVPALLILFYFLLKKSNQIAGKIVSNLNNSASTSAINATFNQTNISPERTSVILEIADKIYKALHKNSFFGLFEDEEEAIHQFNRILNLSESIAVATVYNESFGRSLYNDLKRYLSTSDFNKLDLTKVNAIKNI